MSGTNVTTGIPGVPTSPLVGAGGTPTPVWYQFFVTLFNRTGGALGSLSVQLDTISSALGSILYRANSGWVGLGIGAAGRVLKVVGGLPTWSQLDGASFANQAAASFFAAPSGAPGQASFRLVASADLVSVAGQFPGTTSGGDASAGKVGEELTAEVDPGSAVSLVSGASKDICSRALTAGDWDVWATVGSAPAGGTTTSLIKAWLSTTSATDPGAPNSGAYLSLNLPIGAGLGQVLPVGKIRISMSATTTVYLSTNMTFATSTMAAYGFLGARRVR